MKRKVALVISFHATIAMAIISFIYSIPKNTKFYILKKDGKAMQSIIYIGNKAPIKYATAVATEFNKGADEVLIKARGRAISTAVDACQISMNKFLEGIEIKDIKIFTEELENRNVSAIEILLGRI